VALRTLASLQRKVVGAEPFEPTVEGHKKLLQVVALVGLEFLFERVNIFVERIDLSVQRNVVVALRCQFNAVVVAPLGLAVCLNLLQALLQSCCVCAFLEGCNFCVADSDPGLVVGHVLLDLAL